MSSHPALLFEASRGFLVPTPLSRLQEFVFGTLTEWLHIYNIYLYCSLWVLNGLLQSAVWPCVVAVMGNWFGKSGCVLILVLTLQIYFGSECSSPKWRIHSGSCPTAHV